MRFRIPPRLAQDRDLTDLFRQIDTEFERLAGSRNVDWKGRRIINAGNAQADGDYVTLIDVKNLIAKAFKSKSSPILAGAGGGGGTGGSGGGGGGSGVPANAAPLYDGSTIVSDYAAANPAQLANSCQNTGGTWDFMDGVVAALQAVDPRFGFNGKRGNVNDPSQDAISYYWGDLGVMAAGSPEVYVVDIIGGHCGPSPTPAWNNVTGQGGAGGAWLPTR